MSLKQLTGTIRQYPFWPYLRTYQSRYLIGLGALIVVDIINVSIPLLLRSAIDAIPENNLNSIYVASGLLLLFYLMQSVCRYTWRVFMLGTSHRVARDLRLRLYHHLQELPFAHYQKIRTGDLMSRATNDIESIRMALGQGILVSADAFIMFLLIVPVMLYLSWKLTFLAFAFYPFVPWLTTKLGNRIDELFGSLQTKMSRMSTFTQETFSAIRLVKSLVLESKNHARFVGLSENYRKEGVRLAKYQAVFSPSLDLITGMGTFLILLIGGMDTINGVITVGTFVAFQRFVAQLSWPMEAIGWAVTLNREGIAAHRRIVEVLETETIQSTLRPPLTKNSSLLLEVNQLHFSYPNDTRFSLSIHSLEITPGQKVGVVGPVASGKSSLFHLIQRLYEPPVGTLYWKGTDITSIPLESLRQKIACVEQEIFLFSEKISDNISLGSPHFERPPELLAELSLINKEIEALELGYHTLLGERGINLSGGQKQRLALARALHRSPELLLLDDAFSAVDVDVEERIIQNLITIPKLTLFIASHRLSVMPLLDQIFVLDQGKIVGRGTHTDLLRNSILYRTLWDSRNRELDGILVDDVSSKETVI